MELYIARDKDGSLFLYNYFPVRDNDFDQFTVDGDEHIFSSDSEEWFGY